MRMTFLASFSEILRRDILQNPSWKTLLVESFFKKIAGIDSRLAILLKRCFSHGGFLITTTEFLTLRKS